MDGFVGQAEKGSSCTTNDPNCSPCTAGSHTQCIDVMGYHDAAEIPNYWAYAENFVLQDHMYEPNASWSLPEHLYQVSEWSAFCTDPNNPFSCTNALQNPNPSDGQAALRLDRHDLPAAPVRRQLGLLRVPGHRARLRERQRDDLRSGPAGTEDPGIWNPLPSFTDVTQDGQLGNIQTLTNFFTAAKSGTLPAVSWIDPNGKVSEHPPALVSAGQTYVTGLINAIMQSPDWDSTAIFLSWDDWGGFYDHVVPPVGGRERLRPARARNRDQPVRQAAARSTPRRSATTRTTSSSRTTSSAASGSTRRPTGGPTRVPTCARTARSSATSSATSTSARRRDRR